MFLFLSIRLGTSRRQTQCPQLGLNRRLKEWDIFRDIFWRNNNATAMQEKRKVHFWKLKDIPCGNGRKKKSKLLQVVWVTSCLYSVTSHPQLPWLPLEASDAGRATAGATHLPLATPQEKGMWPCRILLCLLKCYPNECPPYTKGYHFRATWK